MTKTECIKMKTTIENVINNLKELQLIPYDDMYNEILIAFGDYEENGKTEVIVSELEIGKKYEAYINCKNAKSFIIETVTSEESPDLIDLLNVVNVY